MLIKKPSAWGPIALSLIVIGAWIISFATHAVPQRQPDEGTGAHLFQIWLALEFFLIIFFGIKWLPQLPKSAAIILIFQILTVLAGCYPVYFFKL